MKNILFATIVLGLMSCTSQKKIETSAIPFDIGQSTYQESLGGRAESGTSAELRIPLSEQSNDLTFVKVYFRGRALNCELMTKEGLTTLVATYKSTDSANAAISKEGKQMQESFKLQSNQAIIAFTKTGGKLKYVKVEGIQEKRPILYRGRPRN